MGYHSPGSWLIIALISVVSPHEDPTTDPVTALKELPSVLSRDPLLTVVCPVGSTLLPNGTHHFVVARPSSDRFIRLKFNGTLGAIPKPNAFEGEGLARVKVLDLSQQGIRTISRMDSDTFQLFRENVMHINLTFNAIVKIDSNAFDGFRPPRSVQIDLSDNIGITCRQICFLLTLRRAFVEYKGECEDINGQRITFNSQTFDTSYCQGTEQDGDVSMETTKHPITSGKTAQSGSSTSFHNSNNTIYIAIGVVTCGMLILVIISLVAFAVVRRRKASRNRQPASRSVMNINPIYEQRKMSGISARSGTSHSSENVLYVPADRPRSETLSSNNPLYQSEEVTSSAFHIYEEADAIRNVHNPVYDSSGED